MLKNLRKTATDDHYGKLPENLQFSKPSSNAHDSHSDSKIKMSPNHVEIEVFRSVNESGTLVIPSPGKEVQNNTFNRSILQ